MITQYSSPIKCKTNLKQIYDIMFMFFIYAYLIVSMIILLSLLFNSMVISNTNIII